MMLTLGKQVTEFLGSAEKYAVIIAPFIRSEALTKLLDRIPDGVKTTIVTRWRLSDLLSGASDLGVYDVVRGVNGELLLRSDLHAKLFIADEECLAGSANVTLTALGWRQPANFELLVPIRRGDPCIVEFEKELRAGTVSVTAQQRDRLASALSELGDTYRTPQSVEAGEEVYGVLPANWIPSVRKPGGTLLGV